MKQLNRIDNAIFIAGAVLMVVGSAANIFMATWAPYVFATGSLAFVLMQLKQRYEGRNITIQRLRHIMIVSDMLFLVSALLMFANQRNIFGLDALTYLKYIHNNWVVTLLVAAILQLYTTHRISSELEKETEKM
ncbi:MAG: hypothetical protein IJ355_07650 [Prevotella sp.]|nr:hypothetical protein [Prevotella sp.]